MQIEETLKPDTVTPAGDEMLSFVETCFSKGRQFIATMGRHLTPCYVFEPGIITARATTFKRAFQNHLPDTGFYYAMKSNNFPDVSRTVLKSGFGLDVSSGEELALALDIGATDIVFSGPGKTEAELDLAVRHSQQVVVLMDSITELKRLEDRQPGRIPQFAPVCASPRNPQDYGKNSAFF